MSELRNLGQRLVWNEFFSTLPPPSTPLCKWIHHYSFKWGRGFAFFVPINWDWNIYSDRPSPEASVLRPARRSVVVSCKRSFLLKAPEFAIRNICHHLIKYQRRGVRRFIKRMSPVLSTTTTNHHVGREHEISGWGKQIIPFKRL